METIKTYVNKFREWNRQYWDEITWFVIGWCAMGAIQALERGDISGAGLFTVLGIFNFILNKR